METIELPMYRNDGTRIELVDFLFALPPNELIWSVVEFDGVAELPDGESLDLFQQRIRASGCGEILSCSKILEFAKGIEYTNDCIVIAVSSLAKLNPSQLAADDFQQCELVLRALDSTAWNISASSPGILDALASVNTFNSLEENCLSSSIWLINTETGFIPVPARNERVDKT